MVVGAGTFELTRYVHKVDRSNFSPVVIVHDLLLIYILVTCKRYFTTKSGRSCFLGTSHRVQCNEHYCARGRMDGRLHIKVNVISVGEKVCKSADTLKVHSIVAFSVLCGSLSM